MPGIEFDTTRCCAPMVNCSDAPFRSLVLKYGASCVYSQMLSSEQIVHDDSYLPANIPDQDTMFMHSRPFVVQICGNDPETLAGATRKISVRGNVDAVDLNLGCPQERARVGQYGSYLLDKHLWPNVFSCVRAMHDALVESGVHLFCKIRLVEGSDVLSDTERFCESLAESGAELICIHGRRRGSAKARRCGPADLRLIGEISSRLSRKFPNLRIVSNGNIYCRSDIPKACKESYPACGVMSAEGILRDPAIFFERKQDRNPNR